MTKGSEQLYVCPGKCGENDRGGLPCPHEGNHDINECKKWAKPEMCPACIPVKPEKKEVKQPCPRCKQMVEGGGMASHNCIEPEKKEEKCERCGRKMNKYIGNGIYQCPFCGLKKEGTGKAVGQEEVEVDSALFTLVCLGICKPSMLCEKPDCLFLLDLKQQLESFYRKEICGEIGKILPERFTKEDIEEIESKKLWVTAAECVRQNQIIDELEQKLSALQTVREKEER